MEDYRHFSDEVLLKKLKSAAYPAFDEIYRRHWYSLYVIAYKRLKDQEQCQDIVQDIFTDLWNKRETKDIQQLLPYLHTAVRYKIYTLLAKGKVGPAFVQPLEHMVTGDLMADSSLLEKELMHFISTWLETLPQKRREVFHLRYHEGLSTVEIGERLHISQKTVQNHLGTAMRQLREHLAKMLILITAFLSS